MGSSCCRLASNQNEQIYWIIYVVVYIKSSHIAILIHKSGFKAIRRARIESRREEKKKKKEEREIHVNNWISPG